MTTVDAVGTTGAASLYANASSRTPKQEMDGELFLSLLVTQLANQDPSSPMDTNEMIGQTTQLATMEQLTTLTARQQESFSLQMRQAASALIGSQVEYTGPDGKTVSGTATSVSFAGPVPLVDVGGKAVALDAISAVRPHTGSTPSS